jgi:hypothetical protein
VFAPKTFKKDEFILEYWGQILDKEPDDTYLDEFCHKEKKLW